MTDNELLDNPEEYFKKRQREDFRNETTLTKRERFAMAAMQGLMSEVDHWHEIKRMAEKNGFKNSEQMAKLSVECADALLKELDQ